MQLLPGTGFYSQKLYLNDPAADSVYSLQRFKSVDIKDIKRFATNKQNT